MDAEILDRFPLSGVFEEHDFSNSGGTLWIKFLDKEYLDWIGVFNQSEWFSNNKVFEVPDKGEFLVVAGGQGDFIDPNTRKITGKTEGLGRLRYIYVTYGIRQVTLYIRNILFILRISSKTRKHASSLPALSTRFRVSPENRSNYDSLRG